MQKFTIFTVIFSVILLILVAELLTNDYFNNDDGDNYAASLFSADLLNDPTAEFAEEFEGIVRDKVKSTSDALPKINPLSGKKHLDTDFLKQGGFIVPRIDEDDYNGKFFDFINLSDVGISDVVKGLIYENSELSGIYYEARQENISTAKEVYTIIKEKAKRDIDFSVNETDSYGDNSFYINQVNNKDKVYLVVRIRNYVYGFNYPEDNHQKYSNLTKIL